MDVMTYLASQAMLPQPSGYGVVDERYFAKSGKVAMEFLSPVGRLLNASLDEPRQWQDDNGVPQPAKFNATIAFAPGTDENPITDDLWAAVKEVADRQWPEVRTVDRATRQPVTVPGSYMLDIPHDAGGFRCPIRDGDDKWMSDPQKYEAYRGLWTVNVSMFPMTRTTPPKPQRPVCKRRDGHDCESVEEIRSLFYPGSFARIAMQIKSYDNSFGRGVSVVLRIAQFAAHGPRLRSAEFNPSTAAGSMLASVPMPEISTPAEWSAPAPIAEQQPAYAAQVVQPVMAVQPTAPIAPRPVAAPPTGLRRGPSPGFARPPGA